MIDMNRISIKTYLVFSSNLFIDKIILRLESLFLFNLISIKKYKKGS